MSSACLCADDKISYASVMFYSFYPEVDISEKLKKKQTLWPLFMDEAQLPQG